MERKGLKGRRLKGQEDVKELGTKPITLYVLIALIHLNVDQFNLDLKIQDVDSLIWLVTTFT